MKITISKYFSMEFSEPNTENGYHGSIGEVQSTPNTILQNAVRIIAKNASAIADKQITELEIKLKQLENSSSKWQRKYYDLYHGVSR